MTDMIPEVLEDTLKEISQSPTIKIGISTLVVQEENQNTEAMEDGDTTTEVMEEESETPQRPAQGAEEVFQRLYPLKVILWQPQEVEGVQVLSTKFMICTQEVEEAQEAASEETQITVVVNQKTVPELEEATGEEMEEIRPLAV